MSVTSAVGGRFECTLDPRTGAATVRGLAKVQKRIHFPAIREPPGRPLDRDETRAVVRGYLDDAFLGRLLSSLLQARGEGALEWTPDPDGLVLPRGETLRLLPGLLPDADRAAVGRGAVTVTGRTSYGPGRYREGELTQTRPRTPGFARWSVRVTP